MQLTIPPSTDGDKSTMAYKFVAAANRLFVRHRTPCPITVNFDSASSTSPVVSGGLLRGTLVYERPADVQTPVRRCANHADEDRAMPHCDHFVVCHNRATRYETNGECQRHSFVVPLDAVTVPVTLIAEFACFNSCSTVNRRGIQLVVTLENG